jgi:hypothetical protein
MNRSAAITFVVALSYAWQASPQARAFTIQLDKSGGEIEGWASGTITFDYNYADCLSAGVTTDQLNAAVDTAFGVWNSVRTSSVRLARGSAVTTTGAKILAQTTGGNPLILCDAQMSTDLKAPDGTVPDTNQIPAVTQVLRADGDRHIALAVVYINAESGKADNVANVIGSSNLLEIVFAHEIGHAIGLGHSSDPNALMYYDASSKTQLGLARDDVEGITYLYPRHELVGGNKLFGCGTVGGAGLPSGRSRGPNSGGGSGGAGGGSLALAAEFVLLLMACFGVTRLAGYRRISSAPYTS